MCREMVPTYLIENYEWLKVTLVLLLGLVSTNIGSISFKRLHLPIQVDR